MKWKYERRAPIHWDDGEREKLIEAALARGDVTKVPTVKAEASAQGSSKPGKASADVSKSG